MRWGEGDHAPLVAWVAWVVLWVVAVPAPCFTETQALLRMTGNDVRYDHGRTSEVVDEWEATTPEGETFAFSDRSSSEQRYSDGATTTVRLLPDRSEAPVLQSVLRENGEWKTLELTGTGALTMVAATVGMAVRTVMVVPRGIAQRLRASVPLWGRRRAWWGRWVDEGDVVPSVDPLHYVWVGAMFWPLLLSWAMPWWLTTSMAVLTYAIGRLVRDSFDALDRDLNQVDAS